MANSPPLGLQWRSNTFFIVSTVAIGLFTDLFLYGLVVPILPFILSDRVHVPPAQIQSHVSGLLAAYAGASVLFSPFAGVIADRVPTRQAPFLVGLVALLGATLLLFLGQNVAVLTVARILQGVSAAVVWTIGLALVLDTVGPENLGKTIGSIFSFISIGELAAPVLGGVVYEKAGYAAVFGMGFAMLGIDFIMRLLVIEKKVAAKYEKRPDGAAIDQEGNGETHEAQNGSSEDSEEDPLLGHKSEADLYKVPTQLPRAIQKFPLLYCLRDPTLLTALLLAFVQATVLATFDATIPTQAQDLFNFTSLDGGLLFIALVLPNLLVGPIAGWTVDRYGTKPAAIIGFTYLVPVLILLRLPHAGGGTDQVVVYCAVLALCGVGLGIIGSPSIVEAAMVVQKYDRANPEFFGAAGPYAQLYGLNSMVFCAGLTLGPLLAGGLKDSVGYGNMNAVVAAISAITAVLSFLYIGGKPKILRKQGF